MPLLRRTVLALPALAVATRAFAEGPIAERAIGDAAAKVTVTEWFSLTCPHCAAFSRQALPQIRKDIVETGKARIVFADFPLDQVALTAAMVARSLPPERYVPFVEALFASQDRWAFARGINQTEELAKMAALAGLPRAAFDAAIKNQELRNAILKGQEDAEKIYKVDSTPTFIFNGPAAKNRKEAGGQTPEAFAKITPLPASFTRLRIAGFKSFAEPATLDVLPGLTGIVGPNGCGKSNVVEALRWAMGESSARSLRGLDMDDVIFAGTSQRAARNLADVTLVLEDTKNLAPPPFHELDTLEISRRIERGGGSVYRINGREARARDVQTLFADLASGARASAMVSQGRVGALVSAKPEDRRSILEEAAGITGLHARRHEAELKLRAAETNLARAEDLRGQLETQLEALKRQARQAARYRVISATIRNAESELLSLQNARAEAARKAAQAAVTAAAAEVARRAEASVAAQAAAEAATLTLPTLRSSEAAARTALERHRLGLEQIAADIARARAGLEAANQQVTRLQSDLFHANRQSVEAEQAIARLEAEAADIARADAAHPPLAEAAAAEAALAADAVRTLEADANRATEHAADIAAQNRALTEVLTQATQRATRLRDQLAKLTDEQTRLQQSLIPPERLAAATKAAAEAQSAHEAARAALESAERNRATAFAESAALRERAQAAAAKTRATARADGERLRAEAAQRLATARTQSSAAEAARAKIATEHQALAEILRVKDNERWPRMVDQLIVPDGLEAALGAALGEELDSAADTQAARHWRNLPPFDPAPSLPEGATALSTLVQSPPAMARALSQIGLVEDATPALLEFLQPGQMLISRHGAVWRWDGYTVRPGTQTAAAVRLQQRRRLTDLATRLAAAQADAALARTALTEAETAERTARATAEKSEQTARAEADRLETEARAQAKSNEEKAAEAERAARTARTQAEATLSRLRAEAAQLETQSAAASARGAGLAEQHARIAAESAEATAALETLQAQSATQPDPHQARQALEAIRQSLAEARARDKTASQTLDTLRRAESARLTRKQSIGPETTEWRARERDAAGRQSDLAARLHAAQSEATALQEAPIRLAEHGQSATADLAAAESAHKHLATNLATAESAALAADRASRQAESDLATAREHAVRAEGEMVQANHAWGTVAERILERLGATPDLPAPPADIGPDSEDRLRRKHERLIREREEMGPVNLRAEIEAAALEEQIATIVRDREEIATAIAKLRGSIGHLNREGRERLTAVFTEVDAHFQSLFARMFGGGRAHLALVGSDDPLTAGLEIYAQPPGKKLSALSLLSGGEQALTALSLIFAVFRCNPAPICVLDEVDAPLDDANVDRFCTLLEDMVRETGTRFLVVTHHGHTMARMDRLYGVTMQERGVSRVLSVDLAKATEIIEAIAADKYPAKRASARHRNRPQSHSATDSSCAPPPNNDDLPAKAPNPTRRRNIKMPRKLLAIALLLLAALTATPAHADDATCNTAKPEQLITNTNDIQIVIQTKPPIYRDPVTGRTSLTAIGCLRVLTPLSGAGFYTGQIVAGFFDTNGHFLANGGQQLLNPSNQALQTVPTPTPTDPNWHEFGLTAYLDDPLDLSRIDPRALFEVTIQECAGPSAEASCLDRRHVFLWDTATLTPTPPTTAQTHPPGHIDTPRVRRCIGFKDSDDGPRIAGANMTLIDNPLENTVSISLSGCIRFDNALDQANFGAGSVGAFFYGTDGTVLTSAVGPSTQAPGQAAPIFAAANIKVLPDPSHLTIPVDPTDPPRNGGRESNRLLKERHPNLHRPNPASLRPGHLALRQHLAQKNARQNPRLPLQHNPLSTTQAQTRSPVGFVAESVDKWPAF
eukprot:gene5833-5899_t